MGIKGQKWIKVEKLETEIAQDVQMLANMAGPAGKAIADRIFNNLKTIHDECSPDSTSHIDINDPKYDPYLNETKYKV